MLAIVPAELKHVNSIARRMRDIDVHEVSVMGHTPKQALRHGCMFSEMAWTALVDGQPEAMFGLRTQSAIEGVSVPWLLGTDEVGKQGRALVRLAPHFLDKMRDSTQVLRNLVSCDNGPAIRLLRKTGFTVANEAVMIGGFPFYQFEMIC